MAPPGAARLPRGAPFACPSAVSSSSGAAGAALGGGLTGFWLARGWSGAGADGSRAAASAVALPFLAAACDAAADAAAAPPTRVDCYGGGEDLPALRAAATARALPIAFHGPRDHLDARMHDYRVLVNPSTSDVVATTTAEALAMGKWVVVADLPCNAWFGGFRNCLRYKTPAEFSGALRHALAHDPHPVSPDEAAALSWEAATQRFLDAAELAPGERPSGPAAAADRALYRAHNALTSVEPLRAAVGAGAGTRDAPPCLTTWRPGAAASTGLFDRRGAGAAPRAARRALLGA